MTRTTVRKHFDTTERLSAITFKKERTENVPFCQLKHLQEHKALQFHTHSPTQTAVSLHILASHGAQFPRGTAPAPARQYIWLHTAVIPAVALHHLTLAVESTTGEAICASL